jgi:hypothetical protein
MPPVKDKTAVVRQARQRERERATGLVRVTVTVRAEYVDYIKRLAADLRDSAPGAWTDPIL